jgi:hypothetical protein
VGELDDSFTRLLGRQATDKERQAIYRARDALNLKATDSVWMLLMALQHYETLYEKIPARIAEAVDAVTKAARMTAEAQAKAAQEETKKALMGAVEHAAVASRKDGARAELVKRSGRLAGGIVVGAVALWVLAFNTGQARGEAAGRDGARQQCGYMTAAMSWANSAEGQVAHGLADAGSIRDLASCDMPGWEPTRDGICLVHPYKGKIFGWRLRLASSGRSPGSPPTQPRSAADRFLLLPGRDPGPGGP